MKETNGLKLKLIEKTDPVSFTPFNENMLALEQAIEEVVGEAYHIGYEPPLEEGIFWIDLNEVDINNPDSIISSIVKKADKEYVDIELSKKADEEYVNKQIGELTPKIDFENQSAELEKSIEFLKENKADKKDVEAVKQSGVETNKILVDALNSKSVLASTDDNIKENAEKVSKIKTPEGNAQPEHVLRGKTFSNEDEVSLTGEMDSVTNRVYPLSNEGDIQRLDNVYCKGIEVRANITNLRPENIPEGIVIGGVSGTLEISARNQNYVLNVSRPREVVVGPQPPWGKSWIGYAIFSSVSTLEIFDLENKSLVYSTGERFVDRVANDGRNISLTVGSKVPPPQSKVIFALSYY